MKIIRLAYTPDQNRKKIDSNEKNIKDLKKEIRSIKSDLKKLTDSISSLNIGQRRFYQQSTVFTSIQRKLERFEKMEQEWKKYKKEMDNKIRQLVEKRHRAQIK